MSTIAGCSIAPSASEPNVRASGPAGWETVATNSADYVLFGEIHGTRQSPRIVAEYVCAVALSDGPVLFAVELPAALNDPLQRAWNDPRPFRDVFAELVEGNMLLAQDGAFTDATLDALSWLKGVRGRGADIDVIAISGPRDQAHIRKYASLPFLEQREAMYADNLRSSAARRDYAQVVALVGNLHAQKRTPNASISRSMATILSEDSKVFSLLMTHNGGTAWNCFAEQGTVSATGQPNIVCGARQITNNSPRLAPEWGIQVSGSEVEGFDGYFNVGILSAARPPTSEDAVAAPVEERDSCELS